MDSNADIPVTIQNQINPEDTTIIERFNVPEDYDRILHEDIHVGDILIIGGNPGHTVTIVDMAINQSTGEKAYMLAQSYMPAQDIQVLCNPNIPEISPWYILDDSQQIQIPEWTFEKDDWMRFAE